MRDSDFDLIVVLIIVFVVGTLLVLNALHRYQAVKEYPQCWGSNDPIFCAEMLKNE